MNIPITQSREWQKLQDDLGETNFFEKTDDYQYLAILKSTPVGNYLYLPYGPVIKDKSSFKKALKSLQDLAASHHAIFIRIEPQNLEVIKSFPAKTFKSQDLNPKETWVLDLPKATEDDPLDNPILKAKLPSRLLRYYKNQQKNGLTIETSHDPKDITHLLSLQKALADKKGISTFSENYLATELSQPFATLYLVKYANPETKKSEVIAAGLVFDDKTTRYNLQGAQNEQGKKLHATGILTIELIKDAARKNLKYFDFWGIAPDDAPSSHPWQGFTNFKKTFDGYEKTYAGDYDIILQPAKYRLYQILRKLHRFRIK